MRYVTIDVWFPPELRHPMHAFLDEGEGRRTEMLSWNLTDPETFVVLFRVRAPQDQYLDRLAAVDGVIDHAVATLDDGSFYLSITERSREADRAFRTAFAETDLLAVPPLVYRSEGRLSLGVVGPPAELSDALESLPAAVDYEVSRVGEYRGGPRTAGADLTDRQREAVRVATEAGYYAVPRTASVDDVAAALDCATSTASTHLRKAESKLMAAYLDA